MNKAKKLNTKQTMDWVIHYITNNTPCDCCGKTHDNFIQYACNSHTHGMERYNHLDFQIVIDIGPALIGHILNTLGKRVQNGEHFKDGDVVDEVVTCQIILKEFKEMDRKVLRVLLPDSNFRFPFDHDCLYPYTIQTLPTNQLEIASRTKN